MCFQNSSKYLLVALNIAIFVAGGTLFVAGMVLWLESGLLNPDVITLFNMIEYGSITFGVMLQLVCYLMVAAGALLMVVAVLGICGAWKKIKCCLLVFIAFLVFLILVQATLVVLLINVNGRSDEWLEGEMLTLMANYKGPANNDDTSKGFNKLFMKARCCGVNSYTEMQNLPTSWYTTTGSVQTPTSEKVPATCCKGVETDDDITAKVESTCTTTPNYYYTEGCFNVVDDTLFANLLIISIVSAVVLLIQTASIVLSCMLMDQAKNRIRSSTAGTSQAHPPPYIGIDAVLRNKRKH